MTSLAPVADEINSGDTVTFVTNDCFNNQFVDPDSTLECMDWEHINPATGPVFIKDAKAGDVLKIEIIKIDTAEVGVMAAITENGLLSPDVKANELKRIAVKDRIAHFSDTIKIPCDPMIGVIGVAPAEGEIFCGEPGAHGGNMDNKKIKEGATLYLPVFHDGALLSMGDVHACMGDGEIMVTGLEIPAEVTVRVSVLKGVTITDPMLEDADSCYAIASHENVETAAYIATKNMADIITAQLGLDLNNAGMLLSAVGNLQFCQIVDPKRTVRMEISKKYIKQMF